MPSSLFSVRKQSVVGTRFMYLWYKMSLNILIIDSFVPFLQH
jgi:hypothetical protein